MKKRILALALAAAMLLSGCSFLLDRSYSEVKPYTDRFWEAGMEDILKAESYQDLVNTLLLLLEERAEEGVIRLYADESVDAVVLANGAGREVLQETLLGAYLLEELTFTSEPAEDYCTLTYRLVYRTDVEDPDTLMPLSDSLSLVDLLRVAIREEHDGMTARFVSSTSRESIQQAVDSFWQEICLGELEKYVPNLMEKEEPQPAPLPEKEIGDGAEVAEEEPQAPMELPPMQPGEHPELSGGDQIVCPPCPWRIRYYPARGEVELVEIRFTGDTLERWLEERLTGDNGEISFFEKNEN